MASGSSVSSESEGDGGNVSPDLSDPEDYEEQVIFRARGKRSVCTDQELDDLFTFDLGNSKKKRPRAPSDSLDKDFSSRQARSSLSADHCSHLHHKKTAASVIQQKTPSRTPQQMRKKPLGSKTAPPQDDPLSAHKNSGKDNRRQSATISSEESNPRSSSPKDQEIASALGELTNTLKKVVQRLEKQESRLESVEKKLSSPAVSSSASSSGERKKPKVSLVVKAEVRRIYRTLLEQDENFTGFDTETGSSFKDATNKRIVQRLIKEVKSANPSFEAGNIQNASYGHYRSICQEESLKRRGKYTERNVVRRRKARLNRKLQTRLAALERSTVNEHQKSKLMTVLVPEFMSSEESDDIDSESEEKYLVRPIPWRSAKVDDLFYQLDEETKRSMSKQSKRQLKERILSKELSDRPVPQGKYPSWAFAGTSPTQ